MPYMGYAIILIICILVGLVTFDKINQKYYPFLLYGIASSMVLMLPLSGPYLVGTDIHLEWYYNLLHTGNDVMSPIQGIPQGTSILTYIPTSLWVYKIVYPLLFASVPVVIFLVFKKWLVNKKAFLASFLFIAFPAFFLELPFIIRQMGAEVILGILLYLLIVSGVRLRYRIPSIIACSVLIPLIHYALWPILIFFAISWLIFSLIMKSKNTAKLVAISLVAVIITGAAYLPFAEDGVVARKLLAAAIILDPSGLVSDTSSVTVYPEIYSPSEKPDSSSLPPFIERYKELVQSGLCLDFFEVNYLGKIFRILQLAMFALLPIGLWRLRKNKNYLIFISGPILLLLLCLIMPDLSGYLNITRIVHVALFLLAPMVVASMKPRYFLIFLIPYFLFTSGFVFEITNQPDIETVTVPYNIALTDHRMDLGATFSEEDLEVRDYIVENKLFPIYSDVYGNYLLVQKTGLREDISITFPKGIHTWGCHPKFEGYYIFFRSRNIQDKTLVIYSAIGCKFHRSWEHYGLNPEENIIYQKGDARIIWIP